MESKSPDSESIILSANARKVLERRYLLRDEQGRIVESPRGLFQRVARAVAEADLLYDKGTNPKELEQELFDLMVNLHFLPNSPTLMNAGTEIGQLSACFVLPVGDSIREIFGAVQNMALIHQSGGGTGFSFSRLRPKDDVVKSTGGIASGPVSFMRVYDEATEIIKQGGRRRGANMGILRVDHPDILDFIRAKERGGFLTNFNISVNATDQFMESVKADGKYDLINPRTGKAVRTLRAKRVFDRAVRSAWKTGDPGFVFIDEINRHNPTPHLGEMESTNPCGEQPLLPYESCNLGSINLSTMVRDGTIDWEKLRRTVHLGIHFLDNIIDVNRFPLPEIEAITKGNRKIGLGVMGFAEMLIRLGISYASDEALEVAEGIMKFIQKEAVDKSMELAHQRGSFPNFKGSLWEKKGYERMRNATLTTVAPTGTISIIAGTSSGIEPLFAISFYREILEGTRLLEVNPLFRSMAETEGFFSQGLMERIALKGSIQDVPSMPEKLRRIFLTALDIPFEWHVKMQAAFQKYTDNAVSKTINLPRDATMEDVANAYLMAYERKCKGITIFRYGSKQHQVLYIGLSKDVPVQASLEFSGDCRICSV
ncbi:MAG: vitamin B12-dependent ribonucleotide reductase [Proteobacteria bacterium]|nr:vitamin B12-dependent ribonucleotide reductase [Pseudomonadota bacterium]